MKKNILIIDDSALMRRVISDIIASDNRFQVSDLAENGLIGLDLLFKNSNKYDVVLLDVNMPKMNGLEVLEKLQHYNIKSKVIMCSTLVTEGAKETILALERGAFDFVLKPSAVDADSREKFKRKLLATLDIAVNSSCSRNFNHISNKPSMVAKPVKPLVTSTGASGKLVAIACSTGGPKSLKEVIPLIPSNIDAPIVLVQHMPAGFTKSLADRLNELSDVSVKEAEDGDTLLKGHVYLAPGGKHMKVVMKGANNHVISITDEPPRDGLRPCANIMYESIIGSGYRDIICVVLTGMGSDGTVGIKALKENKSVYVISQDEQSSVVYGMPRAIADAGLTNEVQPLDKIAGAISKNVGVLNNGR